MRVVVRVDVSHRIGTGHLRRMVHLVEALPRAEPIFLIRTDTPDNPLLTVLPSFLTDTGTHEDRMVDECRRAGADVVILDLLRYPVGTVSRYRSAVKVPVVTFHEYRDWDDASDIAINFNTFDRFEECAGDRMLAGPRYCIIGEKVRSLRRMPRNGTALVTFGGSDPSGFADSFVQKVVASLPAIQFEIYEGPLARSRWHDAQPMTTGNVRRILSGGAFFSSMASCGTAVTAAGNSMYELIHLGLKPLVLAHNEHQAEFARNAARIGACEYIGRHPDVDWTGLAAAIQRQQSSPASPPTDIIDGRGAERIAGRIEGLCR